MLAFHNRTEIKEKYLARVAAHRAADEIIRGQYWDMGLDGVYRGCAVGCTIHSDAHEDYEAELGIPAVLAHLEDFCFERIPFFMAMGWPTRFLSAIQVGADLSQVSDRLVLWLLSEPPVRPRNKSVAAYLAKVVGLYQRLLSGDAPTRQEWQDLSCRYPEGKSAVERRLFLTARRAACAHATNDEDDPSWYFDRHDHIDTVIEMEGAVREVHPADVVSTTLWQRLAEKLLELLAQAPVPEAVHA